MKRFIYYSLFTSMVCSMLFVACKKDEPVGDSISDNKDGLTPYYLEIPEHFPEPNPAAFDKDNPLTEEGVALGRKLFYDPILSRDNTQSCGSCHNQEFAFTDNGEQFSDGIDGIFGDRNAMPIMNVAWMRDFFWDGRAPTLIDQAFGPVTNPIEMHFTWPEALVRLNEHATYPQEFKRVFGIAEIDSTSVAKAISQFELTLISADTKFDLFIRRKGTLTPDEAAGYDLFRTERADCFHCHGDPLMTDNKYHNNGLDSVFTDLGLGGETGNPDEYALFKTPTLRNLVYTAPYMHDGRFDSIEEVVDFYSEGLKHSPTIDIIMKQVGQGGVRLNPTEKKQLVAFLKTLTDSNFVRNPAFSDPNIP